MVKKRIRRRGPKLILPVISARELEAALSHEQRPYIRKRLSALKAVLSGRSYLQTARQLKVGLSSVRRWVTTARRTGLNGLTRRNPGSHRRKPMARHAARMARAKVQALLNECHDHEQRRRLVAVDAILGGRAEEAVAREASVTCRTAKRWLRNLQDHGIATSLGPARERPVVADSAALRALAATEQSGRVSKRFLAMACLAEGSSVIATASLLSVPESTLRNWLQRFRAGGTTALRDSVPRLWKPLPLDVCERIQHEIAAALNEPREPHERARLMAVQDVLAGRSTRYAAEKAGCAPRMVRYWVSMSQRKGIAALLGGARKQAFLVDVTADELDAAISKEQRPYIRKRLLALHAMLMGASRAEAAKRADANVTTLGNWLRVARRSGWRALARHMPGTKPKKVQDAARVQVQIHTALNGTLDLAVRRRLTAIDRVLKGDRIDKTAGDLGVTPEAVSQWLRKLRRNGLATLMIQNPQHLPRIAADGATLRGLAAKEKDRRFALRLFAMACIAEGRNNLETSRSLGVSNVAVGIWRKRFLAGGAEALRDRIAPHVPRRPRLNPRQLSELAAMIRAAPSISNQQLWIAVKQRFGFDYTTQGLKRLLRDTLGFVREDGVFSKRLVDSKNSDGSSIL